MDNNENKSRAQKKIEAMADKLPRGLELSTTEPTGDVWLRAIQEMKDGSKVYIYSRNK